MRLTMVVPDLPEALNEALEGLVRVNTKLLLALIKAGKPAPPLYTIGIRYKREPVPREWWQTVSDNLIEKHLDCEDAAGHRAAELRVGGMLAGIPYPARAVCKRTGPRSYHAVVEHPDGRIEDPSRVLGMPGPKRRP
ncbi:MAG: hypothetical protein AB7O21_19570 [Gammaproteobacteria bacterium]